MSNKSGIMSQDIGLLGDDAYQISKGYNKQLPKKVLRKFALCTVMGKEIYVGKQEVDI